MTGPADRRRTLRGLPGPGRRAPRAPLRPAPGGVVARATGVRVALGGRPVLDGVDLDVRAGEVHALVGPNGAGKSTLLAAIGGDLPLVAGTVRIDGAAPDTWTPVELALRRAVLTQHHTLSFPFTVAEVVRMGRAPWIGLPQEEQDDDVVTQALRLTGMAPFADRAYPSLSGGEQARAALARVLCQRAAALLLDEPTAALDLRHQELVMGIARARAAAGDAVLVVLHDLGLAGAHADRVTLLQAGRVRATGRPAEVLTPDVLSAAYAHPVEVLPHPRTGLPLVVPHREQHPPAREQTP
nr:heme ABC transporter ATP-binding protein [Micromonospora sp. DSM 115978]